MCGGPYANGFANRRRHTDHIQAVTTTSVVIPCFDARRWIGETLDSVVTQAVPDLEIIVVDDSSTDGSADYVARTFPTARVIRVERGGPSRARNVGTQLARGAFIQYLDADDLLAPGKLEAQLSVLAATDADVAYGDWCELRLQPTRRYAPGPLVRRRIAGDAQIALLTDFWCPPAAYLLRRTIVERVGGWDEDQRVIEDVRFMLKCAMANATFVYCPGDAAAYRVHTEGSQSTREPAAFIRGCLRNAIGMEAWWRAHGGLTLERSDALLKVYGQVARRSFAHDEATFEAAYAALRRLDPNFTSPGPWQLVLASKVLGYRSAEAIALRYRRAKRTVTRALQAAQR
jgi:GT2 family glycosyltransferase